MYNVSVGTFGPDKASGPQPVKNSHHRNFLSKNDKYYLFYENLCYICSREIRNRCKMQQKKSLKLRLLVIYITFFVVLIASVVYNFLPDFSRGTDVGTNIGNEIAQSWNTQNPRATYLLMDVPTLQPEMDTPIEGVADSEEMTVKARITRMDILVEKKAPAETSVFSLAFGVLGGSPAVYLLTILGAFSYAAIIVLMFLIIHSLRRSIREERTLDMQVDFRNPYVEFAPGLSSRCGLRAFGGFGDADVVQHVNHPGCSGAPFFGNAFAEFESFRRPARKVGQQVVGDAGHEDDEERDVDHQKPMEQCFFVLHLGST